MPTVPTILTLVPDEEELLVGGFNITKNFELLKRHWQRQEEVGVVNEAKDHDPITSDILGGRIFCLRVHCEHPQLLAAVDVRKPMGLYYSEKREALFTGSDHWIMKMKGGKMVDSLDNPFFNDIHGISPSLRQNVEAVFVASTGIDAILEVNLDDPVNCLWDWFATEHGYDRSSDGKQRKIDRDIVHQCIEYPIALHTTHVNSVLQLDRNTILAALFNQGQLVMIDVTSKHVTVIIDGLRKPHGIYKMRNGNFMLCDTQGHRIVILNQSFQVCREIFGDFRWIPDACELKDRSVVIADTEKFHLIRVDESGRRLWEWRYGEDRHIGCLVTLPADACKKVFCEVSKE